MSGQREHSLDSLPGEIRQLKDRMGQVFPSYIALLKELSSLPEEFERRFWASRVEALVQKVKADYQKYQAQAQEADLRGKLLTLGLDIALMVGGMEPIPLPDSLRVGISMRPSGKIAPALLNDPYKPPNVILLTLEEFEAIAQRLKVELLKGTIVPADEGEIPRLIRGLALKKKD